MIYALFSPHPGERSLSRLADMSDVEQARCRAGRHVLRCGECAEAIAAMRALGEAARAIPAAVPSPTLAARVAAATRPTAPAGAFPRRPMPARRGRKLRAVVPATVAAGLLVVALLWPTRERPELAASSFERLLFVPEFPVPGADAAVRWDAPPGHSTGDTVWLHGALAQGGVEAGLARDVSFPLVRGLDGAYRGVLSIPRTSRSGVLFVERWNGDRLARRPGTAKLLLTGTPGRDGPSLDALESAVELTWSGDATGRALAASFERWAPNHPLRHSLGGQRTETRNWLDFFTSVERTYARLNRTLGERRDVRVYEMVGMIRLAYALEEQREAARWAERLVREHPTSPRALAEAAKVLHELELNGVARDSVATLLPLLDTLYVASGGRILDRWTLWRLLERNADSATAYRWRLRWIRAGFHPVGAAGERTLMEWMRDQAVLDSAEVQSRERLEGIGAAAFPLDPFARPRAYTVLAAAALARGEPRRAVALGDSARLAAGECLTMGTLIRATALLAAGETARATEAFAEHALSRGTSVDSVRALIGPRFDDARWEAATEAARTRRAECRRRLAR